ncbi:MAG: ASCH domain-containing protein [Rhodococcus sp. (in: high G+C Gram-positive bacteria)]
MTDSEPLPAAEFAHPGPLRDTLVAAIVSGTKTSTSSLLADYDTADLPEAGQRFRVIDSEGWDVCVIEVDTVRTMRLGDVDRTHAVAEGEGFKTVAEWREAHERFWESSSDRPAVDAVHLDDDTMVVLETFHLRF